MNKSLSFIALILILVSCKESNVNSVKLIDNASFNSTNIKNIELFTLKNSNGLICQITNYGGRVVSLWTPDRRGNFEDIVLGYGSIEGYLNSNGKYFGALIGRYSNRIASGSFVLDSVTYNLNKNNNGNHLHGGPKGFHNVVWEPKLINDQKLELKYVSEHLEEGYPGKLSVKVVYELSDDNELKIYYEARTSMPTIVNLTHHSFFNLKGAGNGTINDHFLQINADYFTPVNKELIPTGEIREVSKSPMDFSKPKQIGKDLLKPYDQLDFGLGYDHNWVLKSDNKNIKTAAIVEHKGTGRVMTVLTSEPGLQFYGGNFLNGKDIGKQNKPYNYRSAFCLETQHFPDSPNNINFPTVRLDPEQVYNSVCIYKFSTR